MARRAKAAIEAHISLLIEELDVDDKYAASRDYIPLERALVKAVMAALPKDLNR